MQYQILTHDAELRSVLGGRLEESAASGPALAANVKARVEQALPGVKVHVKVNESTGVAVVQRVLLG